LQLGGPAVPGSYAWGFALVWLDLLVVAAGSPGLLVAAATLTPAPPRGWRAVAVAGAAAFCVQTVLLDAIVRPLLSPAPS